MRVTDVDVETAVTQALEYVNQYQGYVLSQRTWQEGGYRYATLTVGVPVEAFELLLDAFQGMGLVQSESLSGEDVTDRTIDLLYLLPFIPTPTPLPTRTPTPLPTPEGWRPQDTAETAVTLLQNNAQDTADFFIYNTIVCGPWLLLLAIMAVPVGRWAWRRGGRVR